MKDLKEYIVPEPKPVELIAGLYPKGKLVLLHGKQGSGKSYSCLKSLNEDAIVPVYIDLEESGGLNKLNKVQTNGRLLVDMWKLEEVGSIEGKVVIVDTYTRLKGMLESADSVDSSDKGIVDKLEQICKYYKITLIMIGHTRNFVGKEGIFDDNKILPRNASEELFLEKASYKATKKDKAHNRYTLHVCKGRGNGGAKMIEDWMRK